MSGQPVRVSLDLTATASRIAELVVDELVRRGLTVALPVGDERHTENFRPEEMPPRGTVRFGEHEAGGDHGK